MQTQTLEPTAKWQEVRAEFVRKHGEDYASYLTRLAGHDVLKTDPHCGLYGLPLGDGLEGVPVNLHPKNGQIVCSLAGEVKENWQPFWPLVAEHILTRDQYESLQKTGQMPHAVHGPHLTRGQYEYLKTTGRMPYAAHEARLAGKPVEVRSEDPDLGWYWVKSPDKSRARPACYDVDKDGNITCVLDREEHRRALPQYTENRQGYADLWTYACQNPLSKKDYDYLVETGILPNEHPAAAAFRSNVVSINASNGATLVPAAPRSDGSVVTTTHNQPPEAVADDIASLVGNLTIQADFIKVANSQAEASRAYDLGEMAHKIEKDGTAQREVKKAPYQKKLDEAKAEVDKVNAEFNPWINAAAAIKKRLKAVANQWKDAEKRRIREENEKRLKAGETPQSEDVQVGSGLGRKGGQRTYLEPEIEDYDALHVFGKDYQIIKDAHLALAQHFAKHKIYPPPPGVKYHERTQTV